MNKNRVVFGQCGHVPSTPYIEVWQPGYYLITFNVFHTEPFQSGIFLNDNIVPDSIIGDQNSGSVALNSVLIFISNNDILYFPSTLSPSGFSAVLTIINHSSYTPGGITINGHSGSGSQIIQTNVNCELLFLHS